MVSFQTPNSPNQRKMIPMLPGFQLSSKKRIWEEKEGENSFGIFEKVSKQAKIEKPKSIYDIGFQLEKPLPVEWQQCLDIQSGQIHFYNTRTHKRTSKDPRRSPERSSPDHMSLELELNLPCQSLRSHVDDNWTNSSDGSKKPNQETKNSGGLTLSFEADYKEMVAVVCMRCHMLVMLCKSSPSCPNCKFIYPREQFKQTFRKSCCKA